MTGIFNLKFESREQGNDFEYLFMHLENANRLKDTLVKYILPEQELNLIDYRLNNIPFTPSGFRFENFASRQDNMIYRAEGIIGDIWEKIKAFFKWILDKIKSLFGLNKESPSAPPTQEFEKVEKEASKKVEELKPIINEDLDEKLNNANKLADLIESGGTSDELDELMDRTASELSKVTGISVEKFRMARKGSEKPTKKEPTPEEIEANRVKDLQKEADKLVSTLSSLKSYNKKLYTKAQALTEKMEKLFPSSIPDDNFGVLLTLNGFYMTGNQLLKKINETGTDKFIFGESNFSIKDIKTDPYFDDLCRAAIKAPKKDGDVFDFLGSTIIEYELDPEKYKLTKTSHQVESHKLKNDLSYNKIINFVKNSHGSLILSASERKVEVLNKVMKQFSDTVSKVESEINKLSKEDQSSAKSEALTFIQKLCMEETSSHEQKLRYYNSVIAFINELHEFEKLILKVDNFVANPLKTNQFNSENL